MISLLNIPDSGIYIGRRIQIRSEPLDSKDHIAEIIHIGEDYTGYRYIDGYSYSIASNLLLTSFRLI